MKITKKNQNAKRILARVLNPGFRYEAQEELLFACTSFVILLIFATADVLARV